MVAVTAANAVAEAEGNAGVHAGNTSLARSLPYT